MNPEQTTSMASGVTFWPIPPAPGPIYVGGAIRVPVALPRVKTVVRLAPETLKTLERECKRRGLGAFIDWLCEPLTKGEK